MFDMCDGVILRFGVLWERRLEMLCGRGRRMGVDSEMMRVGGLRKR